MEFPSDRIYTDSAGNTEIYSQEYIMEQTKKKNIVGIIIDHISSCMAPVIPMLIAGGLVKLIIIILTMTGLLSNGSTTEQVLSLIGDAPLYFLPFLLAYTSSVHFKVNTVLAIGAVGAMMSPTFIELVSSSEALSFAGLPLVKATYAYSTIPIILLIVVMVYLEKAVHKIMPKVLDDILSPLVILLLASLLGILVVGPLGTLIGNGLSGSIFWLQIHAPVAAWALFAGLTPILVMTGTHWVFVAVAITQIGTYGVEDGIMAGFFILTMCQAGASFAVFLKAKTPALKKLSLSCALTTFMTGVTEPPIYGICLKYKRPLITSMIGAAVAGIYQGFVTVHCYVYAFPAIPSFLMFASSDEPGNLAKALAAAAISLIFSFILTFFFAGPLDSKDQ